MLAGFLTVTSLNGGSHIRIVGSLARQMTFKTLCTLIEQGTQPSTAWTFKGGIQWCSFFVVSILWFIPPSTVPKRHPINNSLMWTVCIYIYIYIYAFSRCFYPKRLTVHSGYTCFVSMCVPWELNPQPFALLTQCSTTESQGHLHVTDSILKDCLCYINMSIYYK